MNPVDKLNRADDQAEKMERSATEMASEPRTIARHCRVDLPEGAVETQQYDVLLTSELHTTLYSIHRANASSPARLEARPRLKSPATSSPPPPQDPRSPTACTSWKGCTQRAEHNRRVRPSRRRPRSSLHRRRPCARGRGSGARRQPWKGRLRSA